MISRIVVALGLVIGVALALRIGFGINLYDYLATVTDKIDAWQERKF